MKKTIFICLQLISSLGFSQSVNLEGKIISAMNEGIPYASLGIVEKNFGTVAFEDGTFILKKNNALLMDSLVVSALGFEKRKIAYRDIYNGTISEIKLNKEVTQLEEIVITPSKMKYKKIGGAKLKFYPDRFMLNPQDGSTLAVLFDTIKEPTWISEISIRTGSNNLDSFILKCRIFSVDENLFPGKEITKVDLRREMSKGNGVLTFVLEDEILVDQPIFVGFEWIMKKEHYRKLQEIRKAYPLEFIDEVKTKFPTLSIIISTNNRKLLLVDSSGEVQHITKLSRNQTEMLKKIDQVRPIVYYTCYPGGPRTVSGSYITGHWEKYMLHADVTLLCGMRNN